MRAITLAMAGKVDAGRDDAEEAGRLAERLHYPVGKAAALMAKGTTAEDPDEATAHAERGRASCGRASAARSTRRSRICCWATPSPSRRPDEARAALDRAAAEFERLGVAHLVGLGRRRSSRPCQLMPIAQLSRRRRDPLGRARRGPAGRDREPVLQRAWVFEGLIALLAEDHRVVTYDPRGTGRSIAAGARTTIETDARDLAALVEAAGPPAVVVGMGDGSNRAVHAAAARPGPGRRRGVRRRQPDRSRTAVEGTDGLAGVGVGAGGAAVDDGDRLPRRAAHDDRDREPRRSTRRPCAMRVNSTCENCPQDVARRAHALVDRRRRARAGAGARRPAVDARGRAATRGSRSRSRGASRAAASRGAHPGGGGRRALAPRHHRRRRARADRPRRARAAPERKRAAPIARPFVTFRCLLAQPQTGQWPAAAAGEQHRRAPVLLALGCRGGVALAADARPGPVRELVLAAVGAAAADRARVAVRLAGGDPLRVARTRRRQAGAPVMQVGPHAAGCACAAPGSPARSAAVGPLRLLGGRAPCGRLAVRRARAISRLRGS